jgi:hypothetical protein
MTTPTVPGDDFEAAKAVFTQLKDLPPDRQARVLRWVAEGLGVTLPLPPGGNQATPPGTPIQPPLSAPVGPSVQPAAPTKDIKTFIAEKDPRSDIQFAAAVAYYHRFEAAPAQRRNTIDAALLQEATRLAGRKRFTNPRFTLKNAKSQGYLDAAARGEYSINSVGENLVAMTLPGTGTQAANVRPKRRKPKHGSKKQHAK